MGVRAAVSCLLLVMYWPDAIGESIKAIEDAPFFSEGRKRDIFYNKRCALPAVERSGDRG